MGHFHVILLLRPESFSVFLSFATKGLCYLNHTGINKYKYEKKTKRILVVEVNLSPSQKQPISLLTYFSLKIKFVPFLLASHNSMQKKDDKVGNKTTNKEKKEGKKESERERSKQMAKNKNKNKTSANFVFCAFVKNKKAVELRQVSRKICLFFLQTHFQPFSC